MQMKVYISRMKSCPTICFAHCTFPHTFVDSGEYDIFVANVEIPDPYPTVDAVAAPLETNTELKGGEQTDGEKEER